MLGRGVALYQKGNYDDCIASMQRVLSIDPKMTDAYIFLGSARTKTFQFQLAITEFDTAITQHPDAAGAYFGRGLVKYKNRDVNGAVTDLNKAKELGFEFTSDVLESLN
jgi:tetratricopeptide (TPR) repeat protein